MAWYFLRVSDCRTQEDISKFQSKLRSIGRVHTTGIGTTIDPEAGWFVINIQTHEVNCVREELERQGIGHRVGLIEPIRKASHGPAIAKQLALF